MNIAIRFLYLACTMTIMFGVLIGAGSTNCCVGAANFLSDMVFWPPDNGQQIVTPTARLLAAVLGGVMIGWGVTLGVLTYYFARTNPTGVSNIIIVSMTCWYVLDTTWSHLAGATPNALFNLGFLISFLAPALMLRLSARRG